MPVRVTDHNESRFTVSSSETAPIPASSLNDLERRWETGQFFSPPVVAEFIWEILEVFHSAGFSERTPVINPSCGASVFLRLPAAFASSSRRNRSRTLLPANGGLLASTSKVQARKPWSVRPSDNGRSARFGFWVVSYCGRLCWLVEASTTCDPTRTMGGLHGLSWMVRHPQKRGSAPPRFRG